MSCGIFVLAILRRLLGNEDIPTAIDARDERLKLLGIADRASSQRKTDLPTLSLNTVRVSIEDGERDPDNIQDSHEEAVNERQSIQSQGSCEEGLAEPMMFKPMSDGRKASRSQSTDNDYGVKKCGEKRPLAELQDRLAERGNTKNNGLDEDDGSVDDEQVLILLDPNRATHRITSLKAELNFHRQHVTHLQAAVQSAQHLICTTKMEMQTRRNKQMKTHQTSRQSLQDIFITRPILAFREQQQQEQEQEQKSPNSQQGACSMQKLLETTIARLEEGAHAIISQYDYQGNALIYCEPCRGGSEGVDKLSISRHEAEVARLQDELRGEQVQAACKETELKLLQSMAKARLIRRAVSQMDDAMVKRVRGL